MSVDVWTMHVWSLKEPFHINVEVRIFLTAATDKWGCFYMFLSLWC